MISQQGYATSYLPSRTQEMTIAQYIRVRDGQIRSAIQKVVKYDKDIKAPEWLARAASKLKLANAQRHDFLTAIEFHTFMAANTFEQFSNHMPTVFLYDEDWQIVGNTTPILDDQTDKYFFWRSLGDQMRTQGIHAFASIAEAWIRDLRNGRDRPISELPIIGEHLQLTICSRAGEFYQCTWSIERGDQGRPALGPPQVTENDEEAGFVYIPPMRALGLEPKSVARARRKPS